MSNIKSSLKELIGNTPLYELANYGQKRGAQARILGKLEYFNPAGSVKDRTALSLIEDGEAKGILKPGSVIIEPTSGNTGIGLAAVAAAKGYRVILTMPETMSVERRNLLKAYGAEIELTDGTKAMKGAIDRALEMAETMPGAFVPSQFENQANSLIHRQTTGPEIWADSDGQVDIFIASVGTGGGLTGTAEFLKEKNPNIHVIAVEPAGSPMLSQGKNGPHGLQGIGAGFIPKILNTSVYDEVVTVTEKDAYEEGRSVAHAEGILLGITSGAVLWAALQVSKRPENRGKMIVTLLPDGGERYLSTPMFADK